MFVEQRDELAEFLLDEGVDNNLIHLRNDIFHVFGGKRWDLPTMNRLEPQYLYLPLNNKITEEDVYYVCEKVNKFFTK
jgi:dTDP-4-amino-4,6-dideoxygalactose transaminase